MVRCIILCAVICIATVGCQRSEKAKGDSETSDTVTTTDSHSTDSVTGEDSVTRLDSSTHDTTDTDDTNDTNDTSDTSSMGFDTDSQSDYATDDSSLGTDSDSANLPVPFENEWVFIEGGSFEMGSELLEYTKPVHTVSVPSFEILKTEVTAYQFSQCVEVGACDAPDASTSRCESNRNSSLVPESLNNPVNCVTHGLATKYCNWLGGRLPSEAEWEYAARGGGQDIKYPWGNEEPNCDLAVMKREQEIWCYSEISLPVCSVPEGNTTQGLCDMAGNLAEWVADMVLQGSDYSEAPTDGSPQDMNGAEMSIVRGGGSSSIPEYMDVAYRWYHELDPPYAEFVTIRCVR